MDNTASILIDNAKQYAREAIHETWPTAKEAAEPTVTLARTLESLAAQTIASELEVVVVDDAYPEGDYRDVAAPFPSRLRPNAGPVALRAIRPPAARGQRSAYLANR